MSQRSIWGITKNINKKIWLLYRYNLVYFCTIIWQCYICFAWESHKNFSKRNNCFLLITDTSKLTLTTGGNGATAVSSTGASTQADFRAQLSVLVSVSRCPWMQWLYLWVVQLRWNQNWVIKPIVLVTTQNKAICHQDIRWLVVGEHVWSDQKSSQKTRYRLSRALFWWGREEQRLMVYPELFYRSSWTSGMSCWLFFWLLSIFNFWGKHVIK